MPGCRWIGGEPVGALTWVYDGEKFVDGVFEVACADCQHALFSDDGCPRCHAAGALPAVLAAHNRWPVPAACPSCQGEEVHYLAMVPARVAYQGKRADRARTSTELHDPGFHGYRVDCRRLRHRRRADRRLSAVPGAGAVAAPTVMDLAQRVEPGRAAFNRGAYFEAHELWEAVWLELAGAERTFVQGLIQIAAGLHHLQQGRPQPAAGLLRKGLEKISRGVPTPLAHLPVEALAGEGARLLAQLEAGPTQPDPGALQL